MSCSRPARSAVWVSRFSSLAMMAESIGDFLGVLEDVLAVACPELELAQQLDELGMDVVDLELQDGVLALLLDFLFELLLDVFDDLLDAGGMDTAVDDQLLDGQPGHLAPDGVEAREDDRFGRVVHDDVDAGGQLEGADVPSLAADDPALHVIGGQVDHRNRGFHDMLGGRALDGLADDFPGQGLAFLPGFFLNAADDLHGFKPRFILDFFDELALGLLLGQARDALHLLHLLLDQAVDLFFLEVDFLFLLEKPSLLLGEFPFLALHGLEASVQVLFLVQEPALHLVDFLPPVSGLLLEIGLEVDVFLFELGTRPLDDLVGLFAGLFQRLFRLLSGLEDGARGGLFPGEEGDDRHGPDKNGSGT